MNLRVACVQMAHAPSPEENLARAERLVEEATGRGAEVVLFPEYFAAPADGAPDGGAGMEESVCRFLERASMRRRVALAGTALVRAEDGLRNVLFAYDSGRLAGRQEKIHPMPRELEAGITGARALDPFLLRNVPTGGLVCADVLYPEASRVLSLKGAEILLNPVMSPYRTPDPTKEARDALYVARAWDAGAFVLKAGGFHAETRKAVGRSLIASPWGLLSKYADEWAEEILVADLDFGKLREFRKAHRGFQARMPEAYRSLLE